MNRLFSLSLALLTLGFAANTFAQSSRALVPLAHINQYAATGYNDVWGYEADGREYALLGVQNGTSIIDITDVAAPKEITFIPSPKSLWKDIKTYKNYAYVVTENSRTGLQIIDLKDLPAKAELVTTSKIVGASHNISIDTDNGLLYAVSAGGYANKVIDIKTNPERPIELANTGNISHDVVGVNGLLYTADGNSREAMIFDMSDPAKPKRIANWRFDRGGYVHNIWPTKDGNYVFTTEETAGKTVKLWDIRDPANVTMVYEYLADGKLAHNVHVEGDRLFISHYGSGLRILDVDGDRSKEIAHFQQRATPGSGFVDAWGVYPHFSSGTILLSDIEDGLYIFKM